MTEEKFYVSIEQADLGRNIGYLVEKHLARVQELGCNEMLIQLANNVIQGNFKVPLAIGFSTPLNALGNHNNTVITFRRVIEPTDVTLEYREWRRTYSTTPSRC